MSKLEIGRGQIRVLRVLWEKGRATAQEITDILNRTEPVKFSTVATFLRTLARKGVVGYDVEKRTYVYYPLVKEYCVANHAVKDLINHIFAGSTEGFVSFIIKNRYIAPEELDKIREMLDNKEK